MMMVKNFLGGGGMASGGGVSLDSYNDGFLMMEMIGFVLAF